MRMRMRRMRRRRRRGTEQSRFLSWMDALGLSKASEQVTACFRAKAKRRKQRMKRMKRVKPAILQMDWWTLQRDLKQRMH